MKRRPTFARPPARVYPVGQLSQCLYESLQFAPRIPLPQRTLDGVETRFFDWCRLQTQANLPAVAVLLVTARLDLAGDDETGQVLL
jgi:hypothetical protein